MAALTSEELGEEVPDGLATDGLADCLAEESLDRPAPNDLS